MSLLDATHSLRLIAPLLFLGAGSLLLAGCSGELPQAAPIPAAVSDTVLMTEATASGADKQDRASIEPEAPPIAHLEEALERYEEAVGMQIGEQAQGCWAEDAAGFRQTLAACDTRQCRQDALLHRLASLHGMQPGVTRLKQPLPRAPQLLAVLGSEDDYFGSIEPVPSPARAHLVEGELVDASDDMHHSGLAVRDADGHPHVIANDMDRGNQPGHETLWRLAETAAGTRVRVAGTLRIVEETGLPMYDFFRCRTVHQLH